MLERSAIEAVLVSVGEDGCWSSVGDVGGDGCWGSVGEGWGREGWGSSVGGMGRGRRRVRGGVLQDIWGRGDGDPDVRGSVRGAGPRGGASVFGRMPVDFFIFVCV